MRHSQIGNCKAMRPSQFLDLHRCICPRAIDYDAGYCIAGAATVFSAGSVGATPARPLAPDGDPHWTLLQRAL